MQNDGSFSYALYLLKEGKKVKRSCWGDWYLQIFGEGRAAFVEKVSKTNNTPWYPVTSDMLTDDWEVYEGKEYPYEEDE